MSTPIFLGFTEAKTATLSPVSPIDIAWPTTGTYEVGDVAVLTMLSTSNLATPAGWENVYDRAYNEEAGPTSRRYVSVFVKIATTTTEPDVSFPFTTSQELVVVLSMSVYRDASAIVGLAGEVDGTAPSISSGTVYYFDVVLNSVDQFLNAALLFGMYTKKQNSLTLIQNMRTYNSSGTQLEDVDIRNYMQGVNASGSFSEYVHLTTGDGTNYSGSVYKVSIGLNDRASQLGITSSILKLYGDIQEAAFSISGSTQVLFRTGTASPFTITSGTTVSFYSRSFSAFTITSGGTLAFVGTSSALARWTTQGSSTVEFIGESTADSVFSCQGVSFFIARSPSVSPADYQISGGTLVQFYAPLLIVSTLVDGSAGIGSSDIIDWAETDYAELYLDTGDGTYQLEHTQIIPGKKITVTLNNANGATGLLSVMGIGLTFDWGIAGSPGLPPVGETLTLEFRARSLTLIEAQRRWVDDGYTVIEVRTDDPINPIPGRLWFRSDL